MWMLLRTAPLSQFHFRRQVPLGPYYADFASHAARLVIEIDGATHATDEAIASDARRTAFLEAAGYRVVRFATSQVLGQIDGVASAVLALAGQGFSAGRTPTHRLRRSPLPTRRWES